MTTTSAALADRLIIRFADGQVAGRYDMGASLSPVDPSHAYLFTADERGLADRLAENLAAEYGSCSVERYTA